MIDRDKVIKGLEELEGFLFKEYANIKAEESKIYYDRFKSLSDAIAMLKEQADTIKQDDRGEGHWIQQYDSIGRPFSICSECRTSFAAYDKHGKIVHQDMSNTNFCPCCGADMRTVERILGKDVWSGKVKPLKKRNDKKVQTG